MKRIIVITVIFFLTIAALLGFGVALVSKSALLSVFLSLAPTDNVMLETNVLILGLDNVYGSRSDTIMVLHTDPKNKSASIISIPRDTLAAIPGRGLDKINHAYAFGGIDLSRQAVEGLLNIKIPYYLTVNLAGISKIIDDLGGLNIDVEKRMYYTDVGGNLYVNLYPGYQKLSGREVMGYLRYRADGGDFKRIDRQQKFLNALAQEMLKRNNLLRSPKIFFTLLSHVNSNLNSRETLGLSLAMRSAFELGQIRMTTVPGSDLMVDGIYYWRPDKEGLENILDQYLHPRRRTS